MGFFTRLKARRTKQSEDIPASAVVARTVNSARYHRGDYTMNTNEIIFSAASRLSNSLAAMPLRLYRGKYQITEDPVAQLMGCRPNPNMTSFDFIRAMEATRDTNGNAYALIMRDEYFQIDRLDVLDSSKVTPVMELNTKELYYRVSSDQGEYILHNSYLIHVRFASANGIIGINPVTVLHDTLSYSDNVKKYTLEQFDKGINAAIVLEAPATLGPVQKAQCIKTIQEVHRSTGGNILLLESGVTAKSMNLSPVDSKLFDTEKITINRAASVYNMPPSMLGDYSNASYSSLEQEMIRFVVLTMTPITTMYQQEFNNKLLTKEQRKQGYHWEFDRFELVKADTSTRTTYYSNGLRSGWLCPDDVRLENGLEPLPDGIGEEVLIARDLIPLRVALEHPEYVSGISAGAAQTGGEKT